MKKIVPKILIVSLQIIIGALFLIIKVNCEKDIKYTVNSNKLDKLSQFVYSEKEKSILDYDTIITYTGSLTGYGPDCYGCGNYRTNKVSTSSGYHIANIVDGVIQSAFTITYDDYEYGEVRILAADRTIPYKSIVRVSAPGMEPFLGVVLDRGSTVGISNCSSKNGCLTTFDLLYPTEKGANGKINNVIFDILRVGE